MIHSPNQIETFFGHRRYGQYEKACDLRINHQTQVITVLRIRSSGCSLKQYNKIQRIFRSEITTDNVRDLHINKSLRNFNKLKERMTEILCAFQEAQSSVHHATCNRGDLAALAQPGSVGRSRTAGTKLEN